MRFMLLSMLYPFPQPALEASVVQMRPYYIAHDYAGVLCLLLAVDGSDGVSVDVQPRVYDGRDYEPYAVTDSWEVMPGRPVTEWHGDECHDVGCPALEGVST